MATAVRPPAPKVAKLDRAKDEDDVEKEAADKVSAEEDQALLEKVVSIQHEIDQLNERASEEILHVEQKYNKLRQPHYQKRSQAIKSMPDFWHTTLVNNTQFSELVNGEDETALQYLNNLTVEEYEDPNSGYKISFHFRPNPYFENEVVSKEVVMEGSGDTTVTDTQILWKEGKDLTARPSVDLEGEDGSRKRGLEELPSFFSWFSADSGLEEAGEIIRDDIWPNPLQFYLNPDTTLNETYEDEEEEDGLDEEDDDDEDPEVIDLSGDLSEDDDADDDEV